MANLKNICRWLALCVAVCIAALAGGKEETSATQFSNPLYPRDHADPGVIRAGDELLSVATSGCHDYGALPIRASRADDRTSWSRVSAVFTKNTYPSWATQCDYWAPEIHKVGDRYICYFCVSDKSGRHVIGAATSSSPTGPYTDIGRPLAANPYYGIIDPSYFKDPVSGRHFVLWTEERKPRPNAITEVEPDGVTLKGETQRILYHDQEWESDIVEAPNIIHRDGYYYLFYSGNSTFTKNNYAVGVARSKDVSGPYVKFPKPILKGNDRWNSPGHQFVFEESPGKWTLFYHARNGKKPKNQARIFLSDPITWNADGWPVVGDGTPSLGAPASSPAKSP